MVHRTAELPATMAMFSRQSQSCQESQVGRDLRSCLGTFHWDIWFAVVRTECWTRRAFGLIQQSCSDVVIYLTGVTTFLTIDKSSVFASNPLIRDISITAWEEADWGSPLIGLYLHRVKAEQDPDSMKRTTFSHFGPTCILYLFITNMPVNTSYPFH